jgi:hypothetical protein
VLKAQNMANEMYKQLKIDNTGFNIVCNAANNSVKWTNNKLKGPTACDLEVQKSLL